MTTDLIFLFAPIQLNLCSSSYKLTIFGQIKSLQYGIDYFNNQAVNTGLKVYTRPKKKPLQ